MLGGKPRSKLRCLIGFWASSCLIVDFANSVIERAELYDKLSQLNPRGQTALKPADFLEFVPS